VTTFDIDTKGSGLYPRPQEIEWKDGSFVIKSGTRICVTCKEDLKAAGLLQQQLEERFNELLPVVIQEAGVSEGDILLGRTNEALKAEGYTLSVTEKGIEIFGADRAGVIYGTQTLLQVGVKDSKGHLTFPALQIKDWPYKPIRGVHVYMPGREGIASFKRVIKGLAHIKMNTIIIEVGGGMEYERHPEINKAWEYFCKIAEAYPGGPNGVQASEAYWKDSLHTELGGGSYLTKAEVGDIVSYAKNLGMKVIPEIQALSHSYYLAASHREIAERPHELFPDTCCPSNPETYKLYFEVAEEVIEVFEPEIVSIGHDEVRILGECPLCKDKTGEEILAYELNKLHAFYSSKGIQMAMWGEKLQNFIGYNGRRYGGIADEFTNSRGVHYSMPDTHKAVDMVPKDILMLDWYYGLASDTELGFKEKGFKEIFGNFDGSRIADWEIRSSRDNVLGGEVSTWCYADDYTFARNNETLDFVFSAGILWWSGFKDAMWPEEFDKVLSTLPKIREIMQGVSYSLISKNVEGFKTFFAGEDEYQPKITLPFEKVKWISDNKVAELLKEQRNAGILKGVETFAPHRWNLPSTALEVKVGTKLKSLVFLHSAAKSMGYVPSWKLIDLQTHLLGKYIIIYEDNTVEYIDVQYGINVGHFDMDWGRHREETEEVSETIDDRPDEVAGAKKKKSPLYNHRGSWRGSLAYFTIPVRIETPEGVKTVYAYEWMNPNPEKIIKEVRVVGLTKDTEQKLYLFKVAGAL
jgi:hypothetical protein